MRYRKKPIDVEARQWDGSQQSQRDIVNWSGGIVGGFFDGSHHLIVRTLEGDMRANPGDWIVCGVQGEFYAVRDDIFQQTYERSPDE